MDYAKIKNHRIKNKEKEGIICMETISSFGIVSQK